MARKRSARLIRNFAAVDAAEVMSDARLVGDWWEGPRSR